MATKFPRVELQNIEKLSISFKKGEAKISFVVPQPGPEILKLVYLQGTANLINAVIESPQAEFDLKITPVRISTGEVVEE